MVHQVSGAEKLRQLLTVLQVLEEEDAAPRPAAESVEPSPDALAEASP